MTQLSLLDGHARATDPDTSHAAAASMAPHIGRQAAQVLEAIRTFHSMHGKGATAWEITTLIGPYDIQQSVAARRCTDLADAGLIVDSGLRRPGRTGRNLIAWCPTGPP